MFSFSESLKVNYGSVSHGPPNIRCAAEHGYQAPWRSGIYLRRLRTIESLRPSANCELSSHAWADCTRSYRVPKTHEGANKLSQIWLLDLRCLVGRKQGCQPHEPEQILDWMTPDRQEFHSGAGRRLSPMVPRPRDRRRTGIHAAARRCANRDLVPSIRNQDQ
jgi:hypothetical protein